MNSLLLVTLCMSLIKRPTYWTACRRNMTHWSLMWLWPIWATTSLLPLSMIFSLILICVWLTTGLLHLHLISALSLLEMVAARFPLPLVAMVAALIRDVVVAIKVVTAHFNSLHLTNHHLLWLEPILNDLLVQPVKFGIFQSTQTIMGLARSRWATVQVWLYLILALRPFHSIYIFSS